MSLLPPLSDVDDDNDNMARAIPDQPSPGVRPHAVLTPTTSLLCERVNFRDILGAPSLTKITKPITIQSPLTHVRRPLLLQFSYPTVHFRPCPPKLHLSDFSYLSRSSISLLSSPSTPYLSLMPNLFEHANDQHNTPMWWVRHPDGFTTSLTCIS